ncbi:MAG: FHA domain-containing protein [Myxococcales bacterium]|nr:FHA domain-containing protein [Myxococcales bacterium]
MAILRADAGRELALPARCLIGRSRACDLVIAEATVSSRHASLEWKDGAWELLDLGSRNGTFVDDVRLQSGARVLLGAGARLRFGRSAAPWVLVDAGPPELMAIDVQSGAGQRAEGGVLALPDPAAAELFIHQEASGGWILEDGDEARVIVDRELVHDRGGRTWRIHLPTADPRTLQESLAALLVGRLRLRFAHSLDEEYVELVAFAGERRLDLQARAHHYPLLVLARRRLADHEAGVGPEDAGWIRQEELTRMLRMDDNHLNISIYRARAQLGKLGVVDAAGLVERRPGTRQLRLGVEAIELALIEPS